MQEESREGHGRRVGNLDQYSQRWRMRHGRACIQAAAWTACSWE
jgi:hypothetical protein